jgi:hypothetical protein
LRFWRAVGSRGRTRGRATEREAAAFGDTETGRLFRADAQDIAGGMLSTSDQAGD